MHMWTRVLVEDEAGDLGNDFDAFYFLGPLDVRAFFTRGGAVTVTAGIEEYFARKFTMDPDFRDAYSVPGVAWDPDWATDANRRAKLSKQRKAREKWAELRKRFFRFYSVRASAHFSLGCHDEWNIFCLLNRARLKKSRSAKLANGDVGELLAGFFDGRQIDPGAAVSEVSAGYAV